MCFASTNVKSEKTKITAVFLQKTVLLALLLGDQEVVKLRFVTHTHAHTIYQS